MAANDQRLTSRQVQRLTYAALYMAIALALPLITGQIPQMGQALLPMHIPVILCGFLCGWPWGLAVGFLSPLVRSVLFTMPAMFPDAVAMAFELAVYGALAGLMRRALPKKPWAVYPALVISMIAGRIVWGLVRLALAGLSHSEFTFELFLTGAVTRAVPGIIVQLILIPLLVMAMEKAGLSLNS